MSVSFELGFLVFLNYGRADAAAQALEDGIGLFEHAEALGYDSGWVRVHHAAQTLTAPFPFFGAVAARTSRIKLGTAVIPVGYEDPLRFAENAATADLLSGGRLELGLSSGIQVDDGLDAVTRRARVRERLAGIQAALAPRPELEAADAPEHLPHGPVHPGGHDLALPVAPGLHERLWYGAGSLESALRTARDGLNLVLSTIHGEATGPTLGHTQAEVIRAYREEFAAHHPERTSRVAISRSILPIVDEGDAARFGAHKEYYDALVTPDGRYTDGSGFGGQASPLYSGAPAEIIDALGADPSLELADIVLLTPISELDLAAKRHVFRTVAEHVAGPLGWRGRA